MILLAIGNESSHIQLTWRHMKIKHKSGKWIASNRFKSNVAFGFFNWFFFRWNAFEIGWSHTFTHTCLLKLYTNFRSLVLLGIVHTTYRSQRYDQTHNTILIVCNYRLKDHLSVYFKEKEKCSLSKQVRSRVVEKVIARLHYMELTEVNRNKTYDVERKTMISIEKKEEKKTNNPIVITSHTVTSPGLHGRSDDRATINWSFICNSNCFSHWMHENHSIKCQLKPEMRTW